MRILVTGGTGFVGSQLVAALVRRGDTVRVLRRKSSSLVALEGLPVEHCLGDILDPAAVSEAVAGCDVVFHVAALSSYWRARRDDVYRVNVEGTRVVMEACVQARVPRVVHTSSVAAIGIRPDRQPADENTPFDTLSTTFAYADSKHRAEAEVQRAVAKGLDAVIVNPAVVIGAGDHYLISGSIVIEMYRGRVPGNPPGGMCVVDVDAVVQGHLAAAERGAPANAISWVAKTCRTARVAEIVGEVVGRRAPALDLPALGARPAAAIVDAFNRVNPRPPIVSGEQIRLSAINLLFRLQQGCR